MNKPSEEVESTVRVDTKRLDEIMNLVGELVLVRNRLLNLRSTLQNEEIAAAVANLDHVTMDLQASEGYPNQLDHNGLELNIVIAMKRQVC
jgi:two-component system chemotaxis sensor kinase CheA